MSTSPQDPFVYTDAALTWLPDGVPIATVPDGVSTKAELLTALQHALSLPAYFGHNWDALDECVNDLSWLDADTIVLRHVTIPALPRDDLATYLSILAAAATDTGGGLVVVFPAGAAGVVRWLAATSRA